jgi:3-oxoacid CoA-transferase subunit A
VELKPQGTLAERIRAGGASPIPPFYPATGIAEGKMRDSAGGDVSSKGVKGRLVRKPRLPQYRAELQSRRFGLSSHDRSGSRANPSSGHRAQIHTPGIYVDRVLRGRVDKRID